QDPYAGISLFSPTFVSGSLRLAPGDVLDLSGTYQENKNIGAAVFETCGGPGQVLAQLSKPVGTFRYETSQPAPKEITATDLDDWSKGRPWVNMLVTVKDVTLPDDIANETSSSGAATGRVSGHLTSAKVSKITNELFALPGTPAGTHFSSITG